MEKEKVVIIINDTNYDYEDESPLIIKGTLKEYELLKVIQERGFFDMGIEIKIISDDNVIEV